MMRSSFYNITCEMVMVIIFVHTGWIVNCTMSNVMCVALDLKAIYFIHGNNMFSVCVCVCVPRCDHCGFEVVN